MLFWFSLKQTQILPMFILFLQLFLICCNEYLFSHPSVYFVPSPGPLSLCRSEALYWQAWGDRWHSDTLSAVHPGSAVRPAWHQKQLWRLPTGQKIITWRNNMVPISDDMDYLLLLKCNLIFSILCSSLTQIAGLTHNRHTQKRDCWSENNKQLLPRFYVEQHLVIKKSPDVHHCFGTSKGNTLKNNSFWINKCDGSNLCGC